VNGESGRRRGRGNGSGGGNSGASAQSTEPEAAVIFGYMGKAKGKKQVLFEGGCGSRG